MINWTPILITAIIFMTVVFVIFLSASGSNKDE